MDTKETRDHKRVSTIMNGFGDTMVVSATDESEKTIYIFKDIDGFMYRVESYKKPNASNVI